MIDPDLGKVCALPAGPMLNRWYSWVDPPNSPSVAPILFSAHSSDHLTICPAGFDSSSPIVVLDGGAQIAVRKQVAGNADLIGR